MAEFFKTPEEISALMLADFKTITGIELSTNDLGREEVIKIRTYAVMHSAELADLQRISDDTYPQSASDEGLERHLASRQLPARAADQRSNGTLQFTVNAVPVDIPAFTVVKKDLDGKLYRTTVGFSTSDPGAIGTVAIAAESVEKGQKQNIESDSGVAFTLDTPVVNVDNALINIAQFRDGRNQETGPEMLERIETHDRRQNTGGNLVAYEAFARAADPSVTRATALDEPRGTGTVDLIIQSGTTDIRQAIENGEAVTRLPSAALIVIVQDFVETQNPVTDDLLTKAPTESTFDVTFTFEMFNESLRTITEPEIIKEIEIFILSALPNEIIHPTELERLIDQRVGHLIRARRVSDFSGSPSFQVPEDELIK